MKNDTFTVGYRTGGTENFQWHRTVAYATMEEARAAREEIVKGGRPAHIYVTRKLDAIGLPDSFDAASNIKESRYMDWGYGT